MKRTLVLLALLAAAPAYARVTPASESAATIPDVTILDEAGNSASLRSLLASMGGGPVVVLPVYTRCTASCPLQTQKLKQALASQNSAASQRVLVFSFDPEETAATIAQYRKLQAVPDSWRIVRAAQPATREFFDFFHYAILDDKGQFIHPDRIFLLDPSLQWRFTIEGLTWTPQEIVQALAQSRSPGIALWVRTHPNTLAWLGFLFLLFGIAAPAIWLVTHKSATPSIPA